MTAPRINQITVDTREARGGSLVPDHYLSDPEQFCNPRAVSAPAGHARARA